MSIKYSDSGFLDGADETKKLSFDVSGVTTGTTRTITMPDANVDLSSVGTPDDNSVTLAKMAHGTDGELITYDATGAPANVAVGTSGQVLTSGGTGVAPTFQAAAGGGKVLQVVQTSTTANMSTSSTSYVDTGFSVTITPQTNSKVLLMLNGGSSSVTSIRSLALQLRRGSTQITDSKADATFHSYASASNEEHRFPHSACVLDSSPGGDGSTAITYKVYYYAYAGIVYFSDSYAGRVYFTAMEIGV